MNSDGIFIDTSIWIDFFNHNRHESLIRKGLTGNTVYTCGIVLVELLQGASDKKELDSLCAFFRGLNTLPMEEDLYEKCGLLQQKIRKNGHLIPVSDAIIATLCLTHHLPLYTKDRHFKQVPGLQLTLLD
jgi:predicted nucleic acid-binding protein